MLNEKSDVNYMGSKVGNMEIRLKHKSHEKIREKNYEIKYTKCEKKLEKKT